MAAVLSATALLMGALAERLRGFGIPTELFLAGMLALSLAAQLALLLDLPVPTRLLFGTVATGGATAVLSFAILARYFPKEVAGRANAALGVLNMGMAFGLQCLSGFIIARWPAADGHYPAEAHRTAMAAGLGLQLIALGVFLAPRRQSKRMPLAVAVARMLGFDPSIAAAAAMPLHYAAALSAWRRHVADTRRQVAAWRFAAAASMTLCAGLAGALSLTLIRPAGAFHVVQGDAPFRIPSADTSSLEATMAVFGAFAANTSPRQIVRQLNAEGVPGPFGHVWGETTIRGHVKRGTGLLNNELYIGRLVWNRLRYIKDPNTGKRVSRLNPPSTWVITEVPELRIIDDELWEAVKARQREIEEQHAPAIEAVREAHKRNRLRGAQRPRYLLSGLLFCGCCGGPVALRGQDRYACSNHVNSGTCTNTRSIRRDRLEARVLEGLKDRLLAPEIAAEAMRTYTEETNRLNRERRLSVDSDRRAFADVERKIKDVVTVIENGGYKPALLDRLDELELQRGGLRERLARASATPPDVHPNVSEIFRAKVARLAETLNDPVDRAQAAQAIRSLIARVILSPDPDSGEIKATLEGELGTILEWVAQQTTNTGRTKMQGVSVSVVAGARFSRDR